MGGGTPHKNFVFFRFSKTNIANITKMLQKSATEISPVPLSSKFYGESESDNQNIDLYRKTIIFDEKKVVKIAIICPTPVAVNYNTDWLM